MARPFPVSAGATVVDDPSATALWRRVLFPAVFLVFLVDPAGAVVHNTGGTATVAGEAIIVAFVVAYLSSLPALRERHSVPVQVRLGAMAVLLVAAMPFAHGEAFVLGIYLCIALVAVLGARAAPLVALVAGLAYWLPSTIPSWHEVPRTGTVSSIIIVPLAMYAFFGVMEANGQLADARTEVARLAAEGERDRIARDLHDLLGHSLTTITVKAALARRLAERDPGAAAREIGEVEELSRRALAEVRAAVSGYREVTLAGELATAAEVLRAAGVEPCFPPATDGVDPGHQQLFGWVVREGVTNVVRHARATTCEISFGPGSVEIVDDGAGPPPNPRPARGSANGSGPGPGSGSGSGSASGGSGLVGLRERVEAAGGSLRSEPRTGGGWLLSARVPAPR